MSDSVVVGAGGFIGRALVGELLTRDHSVTAAVHSRPERLTRWLDGQGVDTDRLLLVECDITRPGLGLADDTPSMSSARDVYNAAGKMEFGLAEDQARSVNVAGALNVLDWAARLPELRRIVHITGYRHTAPGVATPSYAEGAYAASKVEGDVALQRSAAERGLPLTIANPSTVIGPGQYFGLAETVAKLWRGKLPAVPGRDIFIPVVSVEYFAAFLASLPDRPETAGREYTVLDPATPPLMELMRLLAGHMGVRAPRYQIPLSLLRRLPRAMTGADRESLAFLGSERYDTKAAEEHAAAAGLRMPPAEQLLRDWADQLVAARFGADPQPRPGGFRNGVWISGDTSEPECVLLHGLPMDSELWGQVRAELSQPTLAADLPGFGRSAPSTAPLDEWLVDLLAPMARPPVVVAHSLACGPAVRIAVARPELLSGLVLISPAFLQRRSNWLTRSTLAVPALRHMDSSRLARTLGVPDSSATASAAENLRRPGVASRVVAALRASTPPARESLQKDLARVQIPVRIVVGTLDPLIIEPAHPVVQITQAGHYPQLTHARQVTDTIAAVMEAKPLRARANGLEHRLSGPTSLES